MRACIRTYIHTYMHAYILAYMHTYIHAYIHAYMHTYIHIYMHAYIYTFISPIHDIPQGAFGYETLSDKMYINDNRSLLRTIQDITNNSVKYCIHNILILILRGPN